MALGSNGARAVGPVGASVTLLLLGGYEAVFRISAGAVFIAGIALLFAREPHRE